MRSLIKHARVITPKEVLYDHDVAVYENRIVGIFPSGVLRQGEFDDVIDINFNYLAPGFIDIHTHANSGYDTMDSTFEALDAMASFHFKNGVTGFLATTMTASTQDIEKAIITTREYILNRKSPDSYSHPMGCTSEVLGLYLEGPYFSQSRKGAQSAKYIKNPDIEELAHFLTLSADSIKIVALAPELIGALEAIDYLCKNGITVSVGHSDASYNIAISAFEHGATQATHIFNAMKNFGHREPGISGAALVDDRVFCEMICDAIHLHPGAMKLVVKAKGADKVILISDSMMAAGLSDGEYTLGGQKVMVKGSEARLPDGTLAGSTLTLNKAVFNMVKKVGIPIQDAVRMATLNPSMAIKVDSRKGSIEVGKDADLVVFDDNIEIKRVIKA